MTFIVLLGLAIMAPLASNQALLESNQVLGTALAPRLVFMEALGTAVGSALGLHVGALLGAWLLKQSSAQSLRDCPQLELSSQAGLCHQNTNNQAFSTDLISTNWSIASNAQLSSPQDAIITPWAKPTKRLTTHPGI